VIDILYELMDQGLVDSNGMRCGRVDDIVVDETAGHPPRVVALLAGGGAKSRQLWEPLHRVSLWLHALLGVPQPIEPAVIPWEMVERVEGDVFLKRPANDLGLNRLNRAAAERFIGRIPGSRS
jgi:sporulation protein YlmC with PRC-barrel domain